LYEAPTNVWIVKKELGGGFKDFSFSTLAGEMINLANIFQIGRNHQLEEEFLG